MKPPHITAHLGSRDWKNVQKVSQVIPTITSVRHPARIILSHLKRAKRERRSHDECGAKFWREWQRLGQLDAFRFPIEVLPFYDLEVFIGREVNRDLAVRGSVGEYEEKNDIELAKTSLGDLWRYVEMALDTEDGSIYRLDTFDAHF
jgi:hypothetical protein